MLDGRESCCDGRSALPFGQSRLPAISVNEKKKIMNGTG